LEQGFLETFNELNSLNDETCDLEFKQVTDVEIFTNVSLSRRNLQPASEMANSPSPSPATRLVQRRFSFLFKVRGRCRGCPQDAKLFDDAIRRALAVLRRSRHLQFSSEDSCLCPIDAKFRSPTTTEFALLFQTTVAILVSEEKVSFIDDTFEVTELESIDCPAERTSFESDVVIDFVGNPDNATPDQLAALEQAFLESYNANNALNTATCDLKFRVVVSVNLITDGSLLSRRLQLKNVTNTTKPPNSMRHFTFRFRVQGICRGCKSKYEPVPGCSPARSFLGLSLPSSHKQ
jgi:hypothetical protein